MRQGFQSLSDCRTLGLNYSYGMGFWEFWDCIFGSGIHPQS
ncbi:hypothetical protein Osc7112_1119 [Oscillatoria nigro-viridis PCC 7112]|uniref:Uncharacterized protein n=1 Tax=Phormidium nigroviride PCC 7112 TaxID=179408 RepID=K9VDV3_9CYAN|nr:hypothetical protein Osc7112_1119 [Oscillatoria nigro-viridis PCC 7112]